MLYIYNVAGVKIMSIKIDSSDRYYDLNLPKGCYIVKVGKVVRKISVKQYFVCFVETVIFLFFIVIVSSCHEKTENINKDLSLEAYSDLKVAKYSLDVDKIRSQILRLAFNDGVALPMDGRVIKYYKDNNPLIWVNRSGVYERADTFLCILKGIDYYGLRKRLFVYLKQKMILIVYVI